MNEIEFMEIYSIIIQRRQLPLVSIDTTKGEVVVPPEFVELDGSLVLSLAPQSVRNLHIENDVVHGLVSFQRKPVLISFPLSCIIEIFAENDNGLDNF